MFRAADITVHVVSSVNVANDIVIPPVLQNL